MKAYKVIDPDTLPKLDAKLRANPFGSGFPMTIEEDFGGNDIAKEEVLLLRKRKLPFYLFLLMSERAVKIPELL